MISDPWRARRARPASDRPPPAGTPGPSSLLFVCLIINLCLCVNSTQSHILVHCLCLLNNITYIFVVVFVR